MEGKEPARTRLGVAQAVEEGLLPGAFVAVDQEVVPARQVGRWVRHVLGRLFGHAAEGHAGFLGFDDAGGFAVYEQQVVAEAGVDGEFADGYAEGGCAVEGVAVLEEPTGIQQELVDFLAGLLFRLVHGRAVDWVLLAKRIP